MSVSKVSALVMSAAFCAVSLAAPAGAQSISQFGMWGEAPERSRAQPSFLGAPPSLAKPVALASGGARPSISPKAPQTASFANGFPAGSIVIDTAGRKLYYTLSSSAAYVYPIAVGKQGFAWSGVERVSRIEDWPDWIPPKEMHQRKGGLPLRMTGGLKNPLGAKAIYLGNTLYRIHGTNDSKSIGSASSSGCFRMHNNHVVHLARHVDASTTVFVMRSLPKGGVAMPPGSYRKTVTVPAEENSTGGNAGAAPEATVPAPEAQQPDANGATPPAPAEQPQDQGI